MSMRTTITYGYGFPCECSRKSIADFIKLHKDSFCVSENEKGIFQRITVSDGDPDNLDDIFDHYGCDATGREGIGAVISNIMSRETGIRFEYCGADAACNTPASVIFGAGYPWSFNAVEKDLTAEKLETICKRYADELGITTAPDYLELEYYG